MRIVHFIYRIVFIVIVCNLQSLSPNSSGAAPVAGGGESTSASPGKGGVIVSHNKDSGQDNIKNVENIIDNDGDRLFPIDHELGHGCSECLQNDSINNNENQDTSSDDKELLEDAIIVDITCNAKPKNEDIALSTNTIASSYMQILSTTDNDNGGEDDDDDEDGNDDDDDNYDSNKKNMQNK